MGERGARNGEAESPGCCEPEPGGLGRERGLVDGALADEGDVRPQQHDVQDAAAVTEVPVREQLGGVERRDTAERAPCDQEGPRPRQHPYLAAILIRALASRLLEGRGFRLVDRAASVLDRERREAEVVPEGRLEV